MPGPQNPDSISTKLQRIAKVARERPELVFTSLAHHIDVPFLREAYRRTRKDGATGIDRQSGAQYGEALEENLQSLLQRFKSGEYWAPPVRRAYIPKGRGKQRPLGIPTFEDKVLQRAVTMVLEAVYEQDFLDCSYGFRPRRSAHQALEVLWQGLRRLGGGWVLDVDIKGFFDNLDHGRLKSFLDQRVRDGVLRRTIHKWLKAGVVEGSTLQRSTKGSPQGGVISPLLANLYLHEVLDTWFHNTVLPCLNGPAFLVRYADDFVVVCHHERDAERIMEVLPKRFGKYGLELHPDKTRMVDFRQPPRQPRNKPQRSKPGTFNLLGFTHYWGKSRRGSNVVKRKTAKDRFCRAVKATSDYCRRIRHLKIAAQHALLLRKMRGHYGYYGITSNGEALGCFHYQAERSWFKWLRRRAQKRTHDWSWFRRLLQRYPLPRPRIVHSAYLQRLAANSLT